MRFPFHTELPAARPAGGRWNCNWRPRSSPFPLLLFPVISWLDSRGGARGTWAHVSGARFPVACLQQCPTEHRGSSARAFSSEPDELLSRRFPIEGAGGGSGRETLRRRMISSIQICTQAFWPSNDARGVYPKDKVTLHYETLGPSTARIPALTRMEARPLDRSNPRADARIADPPIPLSYLDPRPVFTSLEGGGW